MKRFAILLAVLSFSLFSSLGSPDTYIRLWIGVSVEFPGGVVENYKDSDPDVTMSVFADCWTRDEVAKGLKSYGVEVIDCWKNTGIGGFFNPESYIRFSKQGVEKIHEWRFWKDKDYIIK